MSRVFHGLAEVPAGFGPSVVTVGNFDGVHCGHRAVLSEVCRRADALGLQSVAVTFSPHPVTVLYPERDLRLITPAPERLRLLAESGVDVVLDIPFTQEFACTTAEEFAEGVLRRALGAVEVYEGENFHFGRGAAGTLAALERMGRDLGFATFAFQPVLRAGAPISSSRLRAEIAAGNMTLTRHLLGRVFAVRGSTAAGRGVGREQTVPTLNLAPYTGLLPANGVYVTELVLNSKTLSAVTNIGVRPTFGELDHAVESFVLDRALDAVRPGTPLEIRFLHRLRDERKFESPDALRGQILRDVARAKRFFQLRDALSPRS